MRFAHSICRLYPACLAAALLSVACSGDDLAGGGGTANGGSDAGKAGDGGGGKSSGGSPIADEGGTKAGEAAGSGGTGGASNGTSGGGGGLAHGGAPDVDYGDPEVPPAKWTNITGTFVGMQSECGNMGGVFSSPFVDLLVFGVARQGYWSSVDGGASYEKLGTTGDKILNRLTSVVWDPSSSDVFYAAGIYGWEAPFTDGVFKTSDRGASFNGYKALSAIQSANDSISIDFTDPDRKVMLSGGHEQTDVLFRSQDGGKTWSNIRDSLPEGLGFCTWTLVLDAKRMLVACAASYSQKAGAIVRSTDGGDTWTTVSDKGATSQPLWARDGSIYWDNEAGGLLKSEDQGVTFTSIANNASSRVGPIQLPDGRVVVVANKVLTASADGGKTWEPLAPAMPFDPTGMDYSPFRRAFYATYFDCNDAVPNDAVERYGYDFEP
jgi:photosystem II stability/assembly factor-like uncharacterized protein